MVVGTTGMFQTEYDETTNSLCRTLNALGVSDIELLEDQRFIANLMYELGDPDCSQDDAMRAMDVMYIGIMYHRHMLYENDEGEFVRPPFGPTEYSATLGNLIVSLTRQGQKPVDILRVAGDKAQNILTTFRAPEGMTDEETELHRQAMTIASIGEVVHVCIPKTSKRPMEQRDDDE